MELNGIHSTARGAGKYLAAHGGLELNGRDQGLNDMIRRKLDVGAATIEDALGRATLERFTRIFFECVHPYHEMMAAAAALTLARGGCRVLLLDASAPGAFRVGEALPPAAMPLPR